VAVRRRDFLKRAGSLAASAWLAQTTLSSRAHARVARDLVPDPEGLLDLPEGFSYRVLSQMGDLMSDDYRVPGRPDAMGVFAGEPGTFVIMRNHELKVGDESIGPLAPGQLPPPEAYDSDAPGGVSRLVLDERTLEVTHSNLVLAGTYWNCAGGLSPWGWLSCEELFAPRHGYVFLCAADANRVATPVRIPGYGRFRHEAATVDPNTLIAYLTEDDRGAAFYRFLPSSLSTPFEGQLQALAVLDQPRFDTSAMSMGESVNVTWVDVPSPDPEENDVRHQAHELGAARFSRNEGLWLAGNDLFFTATTGGPIDRGQIFRLRHAPESEAMLELVVQSTDRKDLDMPDNLSFSPHGQLYVAEDGAGSNYLRRITLDGNIIDFAHCVGSSSEFAGPCFAPDGNTLFVNVQQEGLTLAISGPFAQEAEVVTGVSHSTRDAESEGCQGVLGMSSGLAALALTALTERKRRNGR
jgi:secreted PhoX family phosphatase